MNKGAKRMEEITGEEDEGSEEGGGNLRKLWE